MAKVIEEIYFVEKAIGTFAYYKNGRHVNSINVLNSRTDDNHISSYFHCSPSGLIEDLSVRNEDNKCFIHCSMIGNTLLFRDEKGKLIPRAEFQDKYPNMVADGMNFIEKMNYKGTGGMIKQLYDKFVVDTSPIPCSDGDCFVLISSSTNRCKLMAFTNAELGEVIQIKPFAGFNMNETNYNPYKLEMDGWQKANNKLFSQITKILKMTNVAVASIMDSMVLVSNDNRINEEDIPQALTYKLPIK